MVWNNIDTDIGAPLQIILYTYIEVLKTIIDQLLNYNK